MHLSGSLRLKDIVYLYSLLGLDSSNINALRGKTDFFDEKLWKILDTIMKTPKGIAGAARIVLDRQHNDGIIKSEIILNTGNFLKGELDLDRTVELLKSVLTNSNIKAKFRLGVNRRNGPDSVIKVAEMFLRFKNEGVFIGIDLNGDEINYPTDGFIGVFRKVKKMDVPFTIHAGEYPQLVESLKTAISLNPSRIGHAVAIKNKVDLMDEIVKREILIEACPISNLKTGAIMSIESHPIFELVERKVPVVICSDDPGIFNASLSKIYILLHQKGLSVKNLKTMAKRSLI